MTGDVLWKKYTVANENSEKSKQLLENSNKMLDGVKNKILELIVEAKKCVTRLGEIALRPNPLSTVEYIELLIESEKGKKEEGWQSRIGYLADAKNQALLLCKVNSTNDIHNNPWEEYQSKMQQNMHLQWPEIKRRIESWIGADAQRNASQ